MWQATVKSIVPNDVQGTLDVYVLIENKDDQGAVIESIQETWAYDLMLTPTAEQLAEKLKAAAQKRANIQARRDLILALVDQPVAVPDTPPIFPEDFKPVSQTDKALMDMKLAVKPLAGTFIKGNPACTLEDLYAYFSAMSSDLGHMSMVLCSIYTHGAYQAGLIPEDTWEVFRDWFVATPLEILMSL